MKKYFPLVDSLFYVYTAVFTVIVLAVGAAFAFLASEVLVWYAPLCLLLFVPVLSPLFGYAELREECLFIRFGLLIKREIPYPVIRKTAKENKIYSDAMLSLKTAKEHVNISYNSFDLISISVKNSEDFLRELDKKRFEFAKRE